MEDTEQLRTDQKKVPLRINPEHRKKLKFFLKKFYARFPHERYTIFHFVRALGLRLRDDKDVWCGVSGETGTGKSLFVLMAMILSGRPMNLRDNISYIPKGNEIEEKFDNLKNGWLLVDEAAKEMRSVNWQSKAQQNVNTKAMTDRFKSNCVFMNMPNFAEFTKSMKKSNIQIRCIVLYRTNQYARVVVSVRDRNMRSDDRWFDEEANKRYKKARKRDRILSNEKILKIERNLDGYVMDFIVPNLTIILPKVVDEYQSMKEESRIIAKEEETVQENKGNQYKDKYEDLLNMVSKLLIDNPLNIGVERVKREDIAKKLGVSEGTLSKYYQRDKIVDKPVGR